jgi:hypothetical protein
MGARDLMIKITAGATRTGHDTDKYFSVERQEEFAGMHKENGIVVLRDLSYWI